MPEPKPDTSSHPVRIVGGAAFFLGGAVVFALMTALGHPTSPVDEAGRAVDTPSLPPACPPLTTPTRGEEEVWRQRALAAEQRLAAEQAARQRLEQSLGAMTEPPPPPPVAKRRRFIREETDPEILEAAKERLSFPSGLEEKFTPEGFRRIVEDSLRECDLGLSLRELDCSEFPCVAWASSGNAPPKNLHLQGCPVWAEQFQDALSMVTSKGNADGGTENLLVFWALPPGQRERRIAAVRQDDRVQSMYDTYVPSP
ncbi:hypothetical protein LZ198_15025 [Myxococcus sp. K15C18031901]|uniref:hypothetical protein n=1 Tax=Myxococcus dinghuensis TaxID=2906761 RepID=UPI0020A79124|nr:hypothetical protein [Myxococcus dinghuensis]MCP3100185.1 hypothetical protein [Myxococcus dinghuensis]